ncbi:YeeE/YedE thiosulfate transporter family protein [Cetobacterium sp.]|uniref:YeeE/YedE thiosulfate transporter family protein n=1 Tax=Cetobacterium sp. TaxID=2071632 RepID=UPI003AF1C385
MRSLFFDNIPLLGLILGVLFGLGLYYAGATNRVVISNMLKLKDLTLMKIIIFAIGFSMSLLYISVALKIISIDHFGIKPMNIGVVLGSAILALGFGMIGLCPGTAIASFGAGYLKSIYVILGGIIGAFLFTISYPILKSIGLFKEMLGGQTTLFFLSEKYNFIFYGTPWIGVFIGFVLIVVSLIIPYSLEK